MFTNAYHKMLLNLWTAETEPARTTRLRWKHKSIRYIQLNRFISKVILNSKAETDETERKSPEEVTLLICKAETVIRDDAERL